MKKKRNSCSMQDQNLVNLTLIIPTFNRVELLSRLVTYYASQGTKLHFLVLDSSEESVAKQNELLLAKLGDQARYFLFPPSTPFANKLLEGLKLVETEYSAFCADDDLVFINGLTAALSFLQKNKDYTCCDGLYFNYHQAYHFINVNMEYYSYGIEKDDPGARVFCLYEKYESLFYGVFRTKLAVDIFSGVIKNPTLLYQELFQTSAALILGKSKRLPIFYAARHHCEPSDKTRDKWETYIWFGQNPKEVLEHYVKYRAELWNFYQTHATELRYTQDYFYKIIDLSHAVYFSENCSGWYFYAVLNAKPEWPKVPHEERTDKNHNICTLFKSKWQIKVEQYINDISVKLPKALWILQATYSMKSLNKEVQLHTGSNLTYGLIKSVRWLTRVPGFRGAYLELCRYISNYPIVSSD